MTATNEWHLHDGTGDPDITGDTPIEVRFRDGDTRYGTVNDWDQNWQWAGSEAGLKAAGAIVAWRHTNPKLLTASTSIDHTPLQIIYKTSDEGSTL